MKSNITILGTGAWGTALANVLALSKNNVMMWGIDKKEIININKGCNKKYFSIHLQKSIKATLDIDEAITNADFIIFAIPSKFIKDVITQKIIGKINNKPIFINATKGLDYETQKPLLQTIKQLLDGYNSGVASLIGPSFAIDVMERKPTIVNCVCSNKEVTKKVISIFNCNFFKVIETSDEVGSEICAALKNLLAIGIGIAHKNHKSINTVSALLTLGINEIKEIIKLQHGKELTILELCGIGDIFLTCSSKKSRNFSFGESLYKNGLEKAIKKNKGTVEGYNVFGIVKNIITNSESKFPIFSSICDVLSGKIKPRDFVETCIELIGMKEE